MITSDITISWPGGRSVNPSSPITIGRDPAATVTVNSPAVSRSHATMTFEAGTGWVFRDLGSTFGSYLDGNRIGALPLTRSTAITLGSGAEAVVIELRLPEPARSDDATKAGDGPAAPRRPGGVLAPQVLPPTIVRDAPAVATLEVRAEGRSTTVTAQQPALVGRDPSCAIVLSDPSVSRQHLRIEYDGRHWTATDLGSAAGSWLADRRVTSQQLDGPTVLTVGDRLTGPRVELTPGDSAAPQPRPGGRRRRVLGMPVPVLSGLAVLLVAALVTAGLLVFRPFRSASVSLEEQVRSTVQIWGDDGTAEGRWSGSGTIIDAAKGLILTNAHVAQPEAPGLVLQYGPMPVKNPRRLVISVSPGLDRPAEDRFIGKTVVFDGYLDMAIVQITSTLSGTPITAADLAELQATEVGDSDAVRTGDDVRIIGYPGQARSAAATVSTGVISGSQPDGRLQASRAWFLSDAFSGGGNSGGLVADSAGRIIAVLSKGTVPREETENSLSGARPINFARDLIAAANTGKPYTSPYAQALPTGAAIASVRFAAPNSTVGFDQSCRTTDNMQIPAFAVEYSGFGDRPHTDVQLSVYRKLGEKRWQKVLMLETQGDYPYRLPDSGCVRATFSVRLEAGTYLAQACAGGDYALCAETNEFEMK